MRFSLPHILPKELALLPTLVSDGKFEAVNLMLDHIPSLDVVRTKSVSHSPSLLPLPKVQMRLGCPLIPLSCLPLFFSVTTEVCHQPILPRTTLRRFCHPTLGTRRQSRIPFRGESLLAASDPSHCFKRMPPSLFPLAGQHLRTPIASVFGSKLPHLSPLLERLLRHGMDPNILIRPFTRQRIMEQALILSPESRAIELLLHAQATVDVDTPKFDEASSPLGTLFFLASGNTTMEIEPEVLEILNGIANATSLDLRGMPVRSMPFVNSRNFRVLETPLLRSVFDSKRSPDTEASGIGCGCSSEFDHHPIWRGGEVRGSGWLLISDYRCMPGFFFSLVPSFIRK